MKYVLTLAFLLIAAVPAYARPAVLSLTVDHGVPLTFKGSASSVFIANPDIADVQVMSPNQVMIFGKRTGETSFMATDSNGKTLAERTVVVSQDLAELREELNAAIPGNTIKATPVPNGIVLTGSAKDPTSVADAYKIAMRYMPAGGDIINRVEVVGSNQIMIRVRFAEVQRSINNSLGFDWQNILAAGNMTIGMGVGNMVNVLGGAGGALGVGSPASGLFPRPANTALSLPNDVVGGAGTIGALTIQGMIDALAQDGLLTILAEPNLTAMSGETANFLAGGQFPIPIPQGNGTISIQFQPYGISLAFTPTLLSGDRISLHVRPEVSELTTAGAIILNNISVPALTTRKAETTVEVASGESFAIAGLVDNNQAQTVNKFPLLGDMPVLGALFRSDNFQNGQTELVVIITPYVVKPSKQQLALPTDGFAPPSESERLVGLRYSSGDPNARPISGEPTGVLTAPAASPVAPVTTTPAPQPVSDNAAPVLAPAPVVNVPPPTPPIVLHAAGDTDKRSGGLLVE
ncbi:MAG: type II and III secretion system protein family protein [Alphaproteobacteria bacterium]